MPGDIPIGNGSLLINFDQAYQLRDLYWPYVGEENHTGVIPAGWASGWTERSVG